MDPIKGLMEWWPYWLPTAVLLLISVFLFGAGEIDAKNRAKQLTEDGLRGGGSPAMTRSIREDKQAAKRWRSAARWFGIIGGFLIIPGLLRACIWLFR